MNKPLTLTVPRSVNSNSEGFSYFAQLAADTMIIHSSEVMMDFSNCRWFDGNLCAVLGNILDGLLERGNSIKITGLHQNLETAFTRNQFLRKFQDERVSMDSLTIPYSKFQLQDEQKAMDFIKTQLFDKPDMPQMSDDAKKLVLVSIFEICVNAITHGECREVYVCGQIYPTRVPPEVSLSFSDLGRTIKANVNDHNKTNESGNKTILWALEERNTTKLVSIGEPGGIGLKLLQDLINLNKGSLQVVSADGFIELKHSILREHEMNDYFPGTIINIKLRLGDPNFYILSENETTDNIF